MNILLTGAGGFLGKNILRIGLGDENKVTTISLRNAEPSQLQLAGYDTIIHLAGIAHQKETDPNEYFRVNHLLTVELAKQAKRAGVSHYIFFSSSKVYGEYSGLDRAFTEESECTPEDPYGKSKYLAEQDLEKLADERFVVSMVRTPVILGAEIKGNFRSMISLVKKLPVLPLGNTSNSRSILGVDNLVGYLRETIRQRPGGVLIYKDPQDVSITQMLQVISSSVNGGLFLFPIPNWSKRVIQRINPGLYNRLFSSFKLDNTITRQRLNWEPGNTTEEGLLRMVLANITGTK